MFATLLKRKRKAYLCGQCATVGFGSQTGGFRAALWRALFLFGVTIVLKAAPKHVAASGEPGGQAVLGWVRCAGVAWESRVRTDVVVLHHSARPGRRVGAFHVELSALPFLQWGLLASLPPLSWPSCY